LGSRTCHRLAAGPRGDEKSACRVPAARQIGRGDAVRQAAAGADLSLVSDVNSGQGTGTEGYLLSWRRTIDTPPRIKHPHKELGWLGSPVTLTAPAPARGEQFKAHLFRWAAPSSQRACRWMRWCAASMQGAAATLADWRTESRQRLSTP
jgi:hypothetical protein